MVVSFSPAFLKQMRKLDRPVKEAAKSAVEKVIDFYEAGVRMPGLGVKRLRGEVWEARSGLKIRVLFHLHGEELRFILAGNHSDVVRFLAGIR